MQRLKHGHCQNGAQTITYKSWFAMKQRCSNPNYHQYMDYGGRGITVCPQWQEFETFLADMGERPSRRHQLERIDNNKGYAPENVRWATTREQHRNTRANVFLSFNGKTQTLQDWAAEVGLSSVTIGDRIRRGWSAERALTVTPRAETARRGGRALTLHGRTMTVVQWARELGIHKATLQCRLRLGWTDEEALTTPVRPKHPPSACLPAPRRPSAAA